MKIRCEKNKLLNSINTAMKAVPSKSTMDILNFFALEAADDCLKITANNLELGIETTFGAEVLEKGSICVNARDFSSIVHKLPSSDILISVNEADSMTDDLSDMENNVMNIKSGKSRFKIPVLTTEEFPFLPDVKKSESVNISHLALKDIINQTEFSISDNENTKIMTGELFEIKGDRLRVVALDGNRIAIRNLKLDQQYSDIKVIIPGKTLREISKIISDSNDDIVQMHFSGNHVIFSFDGTVALSRLIDGNYYDVDRMLTDEYETHVKINKQEMYDTIDRSMLLRKESDKKPVIFKITDGNINFSMKSSSGSMDEDIECEKDGKDLIIGFNPKFMLDAMKSISDENIDMYMINSKSPCFIRDSEKNYIYLILPVNF